MPLSSEGRMICYVIDENVDFLSSGYRFQYHHYPRVIENWLRLQS